jgi:carbonic anhydrase
MHTAKFAMVYFVSPSEHTVDEKHFDLEMSIVNVEPSTGTNYVLTTFFNRTTNSDTQSSFIS